MTHEQCTTQINIPPNIETNQKLKCISEKSIAGYYKKNKHSSVIQVIEEQGTTAADIWKGLGLGLGFRVRIRRPIEFRT